MSGSFHIHMNSGALQAPGDSYLTGGDKEERRPHHRASATCGCRIERCSQSSIAAVSLTNGSMPETVVPSII